MNLWIMQLFHTVTWRFTIEYVFDNADLEKMILWLAGNVPFNQSKTYLENHVELYEF